MPAARTLIFISILVLSTFSCGQVSLSLGCSNKFQSGNNYEDGNGWFGVGVKSKIREHYLINSFTLGADFQRNKFNLMVDACLWSNKLSVTSSSIYHNGQQSGGSSTRRTSDYSINYAYLGLRISAQHVVEFNEKFDLLIGPLVQFQMRIHEREYNHLYTYHNKSSFYNPWMGTSNSYESFSSSTNEFNGMDLTRGSVILGLGVYPKLQLNKYQIILNLSGGIGFTSRRDLLSDNTSWKGSVYGFGEVGLKWGCRIGE